MKRFALLALAGSLGILGCSTQSTVTTTGSDTESLKGSPAGIATFGFLDITTTLPGLLGGSFPACVTPTLNGATTTLALAGCPSSTGGSLAGKVTVAQSVSGGITSLVETFGPFVVTRSPTLQWAYSGAVDVTIQGSSATFKSEPGYTITVTDTGNPAASKVWTFTGDLQATTSGSGFTLQGSFAFASGTTDAVSVTITSPLTFAQGSSYPVSGSLRILDARAGQTAPETLDAVFSGGQVTINGGTINLGS